MDSCSLNITEKTLYQSNIFVALINVMIKTIKIGVSSKMPIQLKTTLLNNVRRRVVYLVYL